MGKISKVLYKHIPEEIMTAEKAGEHYYYASMNDTAMLDEEEQYECGQIDARNRVIKSAVDRGEIPSSNMSSVIVGLSSVTGKPVIVAEF